MVRHIYNADFVKSRMYEGGNILKGKLRSGTLTEEDIISYLQRIDQIIEEQTRQIEMRGTLKQRINTFRAGQLECPDIRRWFYEMEVVSIARGLPEIEQFLKQIYGEQYPILVQKLAYYKTMISDIQYRMDLQETNKYSPTKPEEAKYMLETEKKIAKISLINEEIKKITTILDTFTNMGDMTVPAQALAQARQKYRTLNYDEQRDRGMNYTREEPRVE